MRLFIVLFTIFLSLFATDVNSDINKTIENSSTSQEEMPLYQYVWFKDGNITKRLFKLVQTIRSDHTMLCKDRFEPLLKSLQKDLELFDKSKIESIEKKATKLQLLYLDIRNNGCFAPDSFFDKNYLPAKRKKYDHVLHSPILNMLYEILSKYHKIAQKGGWGRVELTSGDYAYLIPGQKYDEIVDVRWRLKKEGYYNGDNLCSTLYDKELEKAVKVFQKSHFIKSDGIIGPSTIDAMNESAGSIVEKILLNIERLRWYLQEDEKFVFVNIPEFQLQLFDQNRSVFASKVIVGRKSRPTPLMRNLISYAVLNPYWRAPKTIIAQDILPKLKAGVYEELEKEGIVVSLDRYGEQVLPYDVIDWNYFEDGDIPVIFLQKPGPKNFLGFVKLMFPNRFDVYLHDTDARRLFFYEYRALSSGCVRVQKPIELFKRIQGRLSYREIYEKLWDGKTKKVPIYPKVPVYLQYVTIVKKEDGNIYFLPDVYGIDKRMKEYVTILR